MPTNKQMVAGHQVACDNSPMPLLLTNQVSIAAHELEYHFSRSGGPGGQNVNKVSSRCQLRWNPTQNQSLPSSVRERFLRKYSHRLTNEGDLLISSDRFRDQKKNKQDCQDKLRKMILALWYPPKKRIATSATFSSKQRKRKNKRQHSLKKQTRYRVRSED